MENPRRVLSKAQVVDNVWHYDVSGQADIVELYISYLRQATGRAVTFLLPDSPRDRDPLDAPGQPVGILVAATQDGEVTSASYRAESGEAQPLPDEDVEALRAAGAFEAEPPAERGLGDRRRSVGTEQGRLTDVELSVGEYRAESVALPRDAEQVLVVGMSAASLDETVWELVATMSAGSFLALLTTAVAGTVVVRRSLRPLEEVSASAADVTRLPLASGEVSLADQHLPPGTAVTAAVRTTPDGWAEASVQDEGPGFPPEFRAKLFERFSRLDTSRQSREGSTGLGLSIVRSVVQAHGGRVDVESRPSRTRFTVRLPLQAA